MRVPIPPHAYQHVVQSSILAIGVQRYLINLVNLEWRDMKGKKKIGADSSREDACQLISCYWDPSSCPSSCSW